MLFTRCPECETTFRVTDETLRKASGQVRCGRCASVFNAYAELHDPGAKSFEPEAARLHGKEMPTGAPALPTPPSSAPIATSVTPLPTHPPNPPSTEHDATAQSIGASSLADIVAETEIAAAEVEEDGDEAAVAEVAAHGDLSATDVDRVLAYNAATTVPKGAFGWPATRGANATRAPDRRWTIAAAVAAFLLVAQTLHFFRTDIAGNSVFGPLLTGVYGVFGAEVTPKWDVRQYQILDWIATAEPNSRGLGSLKITARIQNRGPLRQPYPAVKLRLKDRWEAAVGSRLFTPAEYLPRDTPNARLMSPGETTRAEFEVVDPGPDAYGFELDVCIEVEPSLITCGTDKVFL